MCFNWCWPFTEYEVEDDEKARKKCKITHKHTHTRSRYRHCHRGRYYSTTCPVCHQCSCRSCQPHACQPLSAIGPRYIGRVGMTMAISAPPGVVSVKLHFLCPLFSFFCINRLLFSCYFFLPFFMTNLQFTALSYLNFHLDALSSSINQPELLSAPTYSNIRVFTSVETSLSLCHSTL